MSSFLLIFAFVILSLGSSLARAVYTCLELSTATELGQVQGTTILYLTADQYRELASQRSFPMNTVLFMRELPLDVDLPVVAGVVTEIGSELRFSHPQNQADALGIPIWTSAEAYRLGQSLDLRADEFLRVKKLNSSISLEVVKGKIAVIQYEKSVLPAKFDRSQKNLVNMLAAMSTPREIIGDKFADLARLRNFLPNNLPDAVGVTSGYFEGFLDSYGIQKIPLRKFRDQLLDRIQKTGVSLKQIDQELSEFQKLVLSADLLNGTMDPLADLFQKLRFRFPQQKYVSLRSSSDIEGILNTAGLFLSKRLRMNNQAHLVFAFKQITNHMYSSRSFQMRQRLGVVEENLSMPLMAHEYIEPVLAHGIVRLSHLDGRTRKFGKAEYSIAFGDGEKATNPSETGEHLQFGKDTVLQSAIAQTARDFFNIWDRSIADEMSKRLYTKGQSDIEFVLVEPVQKGGPPRVIILQYSTPISAETVNLVLKGELKTERVYSTRNQIIPENASELRRFQGFLSFDQLISNNKALLRGRVRYALVQKDKQDPEFILWTDGDLHAEVERRVRDFGFRFLAEGYALDSDTNTINLVPATNFRNFGLSSDQHFLAFANSLKLATKDFSSLQEAIPENKKIKAIRIHYRVKNSGAKANEAVWTLDSM